MVKNLPANAGDTGLILGWEDPPGEGKGSPLQYSGLENPTDRRAWRAIIHGITKVGHNLATKPTTKINVEILYFTFIFS